GSGNVSPAQSPLLLSSAGTSLTSALLLTLSFIPDAPPCRRRQRLRLCPGSQPPNGRSGLLPMNALSDCCTFGLVLASRAVKEKKTASKTPYEAFRTARRPPPLSPHQSRAGRNQRALAICRRRDELPPDSLLQAQVEAFRILHIDVPLSAKRQFQLF